MLDHITSIYQTTKSPSSTIPTTTSKSRVGKCGWCVGIWPLLVGALTLALSTFLVYIQFYNKCDMQSVLLPLIQKAVPHLNTVKDGSYWLDYGSLLGQTRDGGIIPWEFDLDMAVMAEDCDKFTALQEEMKKDGITMYKRGEFIPQKENKLLGYDGYLHLDCARIYDENLKYYIDLNLYNRYTYKQAMKIKNEEEAAGRIFQTPKDYKESDGDLICNIEAYETILGGCRLASWVFPLKPTSLHGVPQWLPANPEASLEAMYGADWRVPRPKGYKMFFCSWIPRNEPLQFALLWIFLTALPGFLYFTIPCLYQRFLSTLAQMRETKYTILPLHGQ